MGERRNVISAEADRDAFVGACVEMSDAESGVTAAEVNQALGPQIPGWQMRGVNVELSWWDLFVLWHYAAMQLGTLGVGSNRAHGGPIFLPWHRMFLLRLEQVIQVRNNAPSFGLPYWDWAEDRQLGSDLWRSDHLGRNRGEVVSGLVGQLRVRLTERWTPSTGGFLEAHPPRPISREAGLDPDFQRLPLKSQVDACLQETVYDQSSWDINSSGFRSHLEGWVPNRPGLHNLVHVWVGGDMGPGTSPNDPVFYLNHCNVDRIWQAKMDRFGLDYMPTAGGPMGHNSNDPMVALLGASLTPAQVLDPTQWYTYDNSFVEQ